MNRLEKNPLAQLLGSVLTHHRKGISTDGVAKKIGCAGSTYRHIEHGSILPNIAWTHALSCINDYDYSALTLYVSVAHAIDDKANITHMQHSFDKLSECTPQLQHLNQKLGSSFWEFANKKDQNMNDYIQENKFDLELIEYFKNPYYGKNESEIKSERLQKLVAIIENMPEPFYNMVEKSTIELGFLSQIVICP